MWSFSQSLWKGNSDFLWSFSKNHYQGHVCQLFMKNPLNIQSQIPITHHVDNSKGREKVSTSHLQVGELLLLMGDGLLHQDTLNALFHCIFLCLGSKNRVWITNGRNNITYISRLNHERSYPLQCFLLLWGERRKAKLGARALSILHRQSFTSLEFTTSI